MSSIDHKYTLSIVIKTASFGHRSGLQKIKNKNRNKKKHGDTHPLGTQKVGSELIQFATSTAGFEDQ